MRHVAKCLYCGEELSDRGPGARTVHRGKCRRIYLVIRERYQAGVIVGVVEE